MDDTTLRLGDAAFAPTLKDLFKKKLGSNRAVPPPKANGWFRVSQLASLCAREEVLAAQEKTRRTDEISPDLETIFAHGHGLHYSLQNIVLPKVGVIRGQWVCTDCGAKVGQPRAGQTPVEAAVARPSKCRQCGGRNFLFEEYEFKNEEHLIIGHSDGFLEIDGLDGLGVLEGKSINPKGAWEVRGCPKLDHVVQTNCYMWLTGLQWGKLIYWDKAGFGLGSFIEHHIERDEETIESVLEMIADIRKGIRSGDLPDRICASESCKRADECEMSRVCFEREP